MGAGLSFLHLATETTRESLRLSGALKRASGAAWPPACATRSHRRALSRAAASPHPAGARARSRRAFPAPPCPRGGRGLRGGARRAILVAHWPEGREGAWFPSDGRGLGLAGLPGLRAREARAARAALGREQVGLGRDRCSPGALPVLFRSFPGALRVLSRLSPGASHPPSARGGGRGGGAGIAAAGGPRPAWPPAPG